MTTEILATYSEYMSILAATDLATNVITADDWVLVEPKLEGLFNHLVSEYHCELEAGQVNVQTLANFTFANIAIGELGVSIISSVYDSPLLTSEQEFAATENSVMYAHLLNHGILNTIVTRPSKEAADQSDVLIVGISGIGQIVLTIAKYFGEL